MTDQDAQRVSSPVSKPLVINPNYEIFTLAIVVLSLVNFALLWLPLTSEQRNVIVLMELVITIYLLCDAFYQLLRQPDRRRFLWRRYGWLIFLAAYRTRCCVWRAWLTPSWSIAACADQTTWRWDVS